jgi:hypothetical protein
MNVRFLRTIVLLLVVMALLLPGVAMAKTARPTPTPMPALAPTPALSSPASPLPYSGDWVPIQPGEYHWYAFKYSWAENNRAFEIRFDTQPWDGMELLLVNRDQVRAWEQGGKLESFGAATPAYALVEEEVSKKQYCAAKPDAPDCSTPSRGDKCKPGTDDGDCFLLDVLEERGFGQWAGAPGASGTYYVLVRRDSRSTGPGEYRFKVSGDGVAFK